VPCDHLAVAANVILVEGMSDRFALETLAKRRGRNLAREDIAVVSMGGATNIRSFLQRYGPSGANARLAGLCDAGEERHFQRALEGAGFGSCRSRADMEACGFFVCDADLEDELLRALGTEAVERVIDEQGELRAFRIFQSQPAQRDRPVEAQLHRFMGTKSHRKHAYGKFLVEALDLSRVPRPLERVLDYV
jgi:hypothetical protein